MKRLKYILPVLLLLAIVAYVVYERRDSLARDLANSLLGGSGVTIVDVSLDTVTGSRVAFRRLEVELDSGTRLVLEDLAAPLDFPSLAPEYISVGRIVVQPGTAPDEAQPLTPLARQFLALPDQFPSTALTVRELVYPGAPKLSDLGWSTGESFQRLALTSDDLTLTFEIEQADRSSFRVDGTASHPAVVEPLTADMAIIDRGGDIQLNAYVGIDLAAWLPVIGDRTPLPEAIESADGTLFTMFQVQLDDEAGGRVGIVLNAATDGEIKVKTSIKDGLVIAGRLPLNRPTELRIAWPYSGWSLRSPESIWSTEGGDFDSLPLTVNNVDCRSDAACNLEASVGPGTFTAGGLKVDRVMMELPVSIDMAETTRVEMTRDPSVFLTGIHGESLEIGAISTLGVGDAVAELSDSGITIRLDRASIDLSTIAMGENRIDALGFRLSDLHFENGNLAAAFRTPSNGGTLRFNEYSTRLPGTNGRVQWSDDSIELEASFESAADRITGDFRMNYDLGAGEGLLVTNNTRIDFSQQSLREQVAGIPLDADLVDGSLTVDARVPLGDDAVGSPPVNVRLDGLAARYEDIVAAGIYGELVAIAGSEGARIDTGSMAIDVVDVGFPVSELTVSFRQPDAETVTVDSLAFALLGGRVSAAPFDYDIVSERLDMMLRAEGIQLPFMAQLAGFESLEVVGSLNGSIPVTMDRGQITIAGGRLDNEPPGGVIRFGVDAAQAVGASNLDIASRALRNFHFDSLSSDLVYDDEGDLVMKMRLSGVNPEMDPNQPVILNLNVENNIPDMLRSLQAVRSIEEVLEAQSGGQ